MIQIHKAFYYLYKDYDEYNKIYIYKTEEKMKEDLNLYLTKNPYSYLDIYRDLYISQLERSAVNYNSFSPVQKETFLSTVDREISIRNQINVIIEDLKKQTEVDKAREDYFKNIELEKLKKEKEELQESQMMTSLGVAIELAALKAEVLSTAKEEQDLGLDILDKISLLDMQYIQYIQSSLKEFAVITGNVMDRVRVVDDAHARLVDSGTIDENGNLSKTSVLLNVIYWPENVQIIADALGIDKKEVGLANLEIIDNEVVVKGHPDKRMDFSIVQNLFESSLRNHNSEMSPVLSGEIAAINNCKERGEKAKEYLDNKQHDLDAANAERQKAAAKILEKHGITPDTANLPSQLAELKDRETFSPTDRKEVENELKKQESLNRKKEDFAADRQVLENDPNVKRANLFEELKKPKALKKVEAKDRSDRSAPNTQLYLQEQQEKLDREHNEELKNLDPKEKKELKSVGGDLKQSGVSDIRDSNNEALNASPTATPRISSSTIER
jgi:hypothetical protein